jgi:hypothetical protein
VRPRARALLAGLVAVALPAPAAAWPADTVLAITRDARRLLPRSLAKLLGEREAPVREQLARFPPALAQAMAADLGAGRLRPETLGALEREVDRVVALLREGRVSEGVVRMGGLARIPADLSDPVLAAGPEGWPPGLAREYYALLAANVARMPVVVDPSSPLDAPRRELPSMWQSLATRSREHVPTIRAELFRDGRVVSHTRLDYRSPAWAVGSIAYSRAATAVAATWLAAWRDANGDLTNRPRERTAAPRDPGAPAAAAGRRPPPPEAP